MSAPNYPLRLDPLRRAGWKRAAELEGRTLAGWIKATCDNRVKEQHMGRPIEPLSGNDRVTVPGHLLSPRGGDHYVLRVIGDSMRDEGIREGDYVIVLRREQVEDGEMVVVLVGSGDDLDASIKRIYHEGPITRLQPANEDMPAIRVPSGEVKVQGVVVGLMRKF